MDKSERTVLLYIVHAILESEDNEIAEKCVNQNLINGKGIDYIIKRSSVCVVIITIEFNSSVHLTNPRKHSNFPFILQFNILTENILNTSISARIRS